MRLGWKFPAFVGAYVKEQDRDALLTMAREDGQTISQVIRALIAKEAERRVQEHDDERASA